MNNIFQEYDLLDSNGELNLSLVSSLLAKDDRDGQEFQERAIALLDEIEGVDISNDIKAVMYHILYDIFGDEGCRNRAIELYGNEGHYFHMLQRGSSILSFHGCSQNEKLNTALDELKLESSVYLDTLKTNIVKKKFKLANILLSLDDMCIIMNKYHKEYKNIIGIEEATNILLKSLLTDFFNLSQVNYYISPNDMQLITQKIKVMTSGI